MPGSSAEHLNTQNAKGLPLPAGLFNFKKAARKKCGVEIRGRKKEEAVLTGLRSLDPTPHTKAHSTPGSTAAAGRISIRDGQLGVGLLQNLFQRRSCLGAWVLLP